MLVPKKYKTVFVILGATGDLSTGKIIPALFELRKKMAHFGARSPSEAHKRQDVPFSVVAVSRRPWSDDDFRDFLGRDKYDNDFLQSVHYKTVFFDTCVGSSELKDFLREIGGKKTKYIFYVSMAPTLYDTALRCMKKNKLLSVGDSKILVEKPFGLDLKSSKKLNALALSFLEHKQIYRVDHYLGKEALRALTEVQEKSDTLSRIISNKTVASIRVKIFEDFGVKDRGASYDSVGAFRDVGQNHILQMLAAIAIKPPRAKYFRENSLRSNIPENISLAPASWHSARAKVVEALEISKIKIRRGQYFGYTKEKNVAKDSKTETFFSLQTYFKSGKLAGVPVVLESGKKMSTREASITVEFKNGETFDILVEGEAYEHILEAAVADKRELFVGSREIFAAWKFVDVVAKKFSKIPLEIYKPGKIV